MGNLLANLSPQQRLIAAGGALFVVLALLVTLVMAFHGGGGNTQGQNKGRDKGYVTIFRHLDQKEQDEAAAALGAAHITQFDISDDGTLMVSKDKEPEARIALGEAQVPKNPAEQGLEIFNKQNFISTDFDKRMEYIRGLSGELTRWVRKVNGVQDAAVLVNMPQDSLFQSEKKPVTTSVMVKMQPGQQLTTNEVEGIQHMIASAVPGETVDNVTIVDNNGNLLSSGMESNAGGANGGDAMLSKEIDEQNRITQGMEIDLQNRLQGMLDKLLGPGKAVVEVDLELDFSHRVIRNVLEAPVTANGVPLPADRTVKNQTSSAGQPGGPVGTAANMPTYPAVPLGTGGAPVTSPVTKHYETDQAAFNTSQQIEQPASGGIKRMSIAVMVPDTVAADQLPILQNLIATAAGADPARRDQVTVDRVHFDNSLFNSLKQQLANQKKPLKLKGPSLGWKWVWIIGGVVLLLALIISVIARRRRPAENPFEALTSSLEADSLPGGFDQASALGGFAPDQIPGLGQPTGGYGADPYGAQQLGGQPYGAESYGQAGGFAPPPSGGPQEGPFNFLYEVAPEQVAELLSQERPATAAGVLGQLDSNFAEAVIANMPPEIQQEVFGRLSQGASLPAMSQRMVSQTLRRKLGVPA